MCKKHDKKTKLKIRRRFLEHAGAASRLVQSALAGEESARGSGSRWKAGAERYNCAVSKLIKQTERLFAKLFSGGNLAVARSTLLMKQSNEATKPLWWFRLGVRVGMLIMLIVWVLFVSAFGITKPHKKGQGGVALYKLGMFQVYRGIGCLLLGMWLWGTCIYVWNQGRVNWVYIFELDPNHIMQSHEWFQHATMLSLLYLVNYLFFLKVANGGLTMIPPQYAGYIPLGLIALSIAYMVWATCSCKLSKMCCRKVSGERIGCAKGGILWSFGQIIMSPFGEVTFNTTFFADIMTSMVKVRVRVWYNWCAEVKFKFVVVRGEARLFYVKGPYTVVTMTCLSDTHILLDYPFVAQVNVDLAFIICFVSTGEIARPFSSSGHKCSGNSIFTSVLIPLICVGPNWLRMMQVRVYVHIQCRDCFTTMVLNTYKYHERRHIET